MANNPNWRDFKEEDNGQAFLVMMVLTGSALAQEESTEDGGAEPRRVRRWFELGQGHPIAPGQGAEGGRGLRARVDCDFNLVTEPR